MHRFALWFVPLCPATCKYGSEPGDLFQFLFVKQSKLVMAETAPGTDVTTGMVISTCEGITYDVAPVEPLSSSNIVYVVVTSWVRRASCKACRLCLHGVQSARHMHQGDRGEPLDAGVGSLVVTCACQFAAQGTLGKQGARTSFRRVAQGPHGAVKRASLWPHLPPAHTCMGVGAGVGLACCVARVVEAHSVSTHAAPDLQA